jgi:DHA1 family putative efflux transporter-like MFS transporter
MLSCLASFLSSHFTILMSARAILGVSAGVFTVVALSSVAKLYSPDRTGSAIGMIALGFGSAMALGVPIGIAVAEKWGWQTNFALLGAGALLVLLGLARILPHIEGDAPVSFTRPNLGC